jgi:hypothetical protein
MNRALVFACVLVFGISSVYSNDARTRISVIQGTVSVLKTGAVDWTNARPNMPLSEGDQIYTRAESFAELIYSNGVILRLDEKTKITVTSATDVSAGARSGTGDVWVNMRKLVSSSGKNFELSTPTATAAIRGTVFHTATGADSSTDVSVYEGTVAVGPAGGTQKAAKQPLGGEAVEVPGPEEIPGPYEVSLEEWVNIVAGQKISVRKDGRFAQKKFSTAAAAKADDFVRKNIEMDKSTGK